jgi:aspartate-semialdehyde dehydrogenase
MKIDRMNADHYRVAIVGAAGLKGRELNDVLHERNFPARDVKLLDDDEALGQFDSVGDEATFIQSVRPENFENVDFVFFASDEGFTRAHWKLAKRAGSSVVDLSYALEHEPQIAIRAPWVERDLGNPPRADLENTSAVVAHPAAVVMALLLLRAEKKVGIQRVAATVFEPVSERGKRGMDELHEQTVNLLSFQQLPKTFFDAQVAFNMLVRYGDRSFTKLEAVEQRILSHFRQITRGNTIIPSIMLAQSPIFHGYVFSLYLELEKTSSAEDLSAALAGEHVTLIPAAEEAPNNVNAAGQDDVLVSLRRDAYHQNAFWLWGAADNLRLAALTAVDCAASLALTRSRGAVQ